MKRGNGVLLFTGIRREIEAEHLILLPSKRVEIPFLLHP